MSPTTKLIITSPIPSTKPLWFGDIWNHVRSALEIIGAFSDLNKHKNECLTNRIEATFSEHGFSGSYPFSVTCVKQASSETLENCKLFIMQAPNTGYTFFPIDENYILFSLDVGTVANLTLLNIAKVLINNGYNAFYCSQDDVDDGYQAITSEYIKNNLDAIHC
ncbi:hypothetical protein ACQWTT_001149 [Acinetobacter baumannii]